MIEKVTKGVEYRIRHSRKGVFYGRATADDDGGEWLDFEITRGVADAVLDYNVRGVGDPITVRRSHCYITLAEPEAKVNP